MNGMSNSANIILLYRRHSRLLAPFIDIIEGYDKGSIVVCTSTALSLWKTDGESFEVSGKETEYD